MGKGGVHVELLPVFEIELFRQALDFLVDELQQLLLLLFRRLGALVLGQEGGTAQEEPLRKFMFGLCIILAAFSGIYTFISKASPQGSINEAAQLATQYTSKNEVAKFICDNGHLPSNYVNKSEGKKLYEQRTGNTFSKWNFNPLTTLGVMIGGDYFENREGLLPPGTWYEADVDYFANNRGTNRLVYSSGCNIYYTGNHYKTFSKVEFGL